MGILREIGESIGQNVLKATEKKIGCVFKKGTKYYEKLGGKEITKDEVAGRTVIHFYRRIKKIPNHETHNLKIIKL
ncbi:hypothetical protein [uncultured Dokdonia sp.]|uniref:hypothetical protein n=1 Tax=uncultured Dokdonia sp. TaxID=575653 RepID=UPI002634E1B9|nr:hypothetical protein [uncultured Dokdonia sp.]